ncbi:MAG: hypothetical protein K0R29_2523, partial [Pseudobdellovibrio sp.]|nr:hypothetical protein [Pseudobdellovibrio sp.]
FPAEAAVEKSTEKKHLVRSGAMAWVGFAVSQYLNSKKDVPNKAEALALAHGIANYLLQHRHNGLVTGGFGEMNYSVQNGLIIESFSEKNITWVSTEHNIDAYFFLKSFGKLTENFGYIQAADEIKSKLLTKLWNEKLNQFNQGLDGDSLNESQALDCASWGSVFLASAAEKKKSGESLNTADSRYKSGFKNLNGHKPYLTEPIFSVTLASLYKTEFPKNSWQDISGIWVEGSAGVALAYLRAGRPHEAKRILSDLKPLMEPDMSFPDFTKKVPYTFEGRSSTASSLWYWLVDAEIKSPAEDQLLWK